MKTFCRLSIVSLIAVGGAGLVVGCEETVSETQQTEVKRDGSTRTETETVKKTDDGTVKTEKTTEKTPSP